MIAELGLYALILAFGLSLVQATLPLKGATASSSTGGGEALRGGPASRSTPSCRSTA